MFTLRRAALRALTAQPSRQISSIRPTSRVTTSRPGPSTFLRSFHQARVWRAEEDVKRGEASPVEASATDEKVTTETSNIDEPAYVPPTGEPEHARDAVSESSGTTSDALGQTETPVQTETIESTSSPEQSKSTSNISGQAESLKERVEEGITSAAETVSAAAANTVEQASSVVSSATEAISNTASALGTATSPRQTQVPRTDRGDRENRPERRDPFTPVPASRGERPANPPSKILYIGNLFFEVTAPQLEAEFSRFGEVSNSRVVTDARGLSKGFGYVELATQEAADAALQALNQKVFQGRRMAVQYHARRDNKEARRDGRPPREAAPPSKTLFIGNMSYQMSDRDLNDLFRSIRNVLDVRVAIDRRSGQPRGFAHADFIDIESAVKAKAELQEKTVYGRTLKIDFSGQNNESRGGEGDGGRPPRREFGDREDRGPRRDYSPRENRGDRDGHQVRGGDRGDRGGYQGGDRGDRGGYQGNRGGDRGDRPSYDRAPRGDRGEPEQF